jgi:hypothetical protein
VNEKLQIPTAICGTPRFQFQFPQNGVFGNFDASSTVVSENATFKEHDGLQQSARPSGLDGQYPGPVSLVPPLAA